MNAPVSRGTLGLLSAGSLTILLLGAFSRFGTLSQSIAPDSEDSSTVAVQPDASPNTPSWPTGLRSEFAEIVKLAQAHVGDDVILEYIKNSGETYNASENDLAYLADLGLSPQVRAALSKPLPIETNPSLSPSPSISTNAVAFTKALAPYGTWTQVPDLGPCWQPTVETINPDWRPYVDQGQWLYTDAGWSWQSQYSWGWAPFHYGRWSKQPQLGWVWVPDQVWGPSWVAWRSTGSYWGWAPLPPGVSLSVAAGLTFQNRPIGPDFDFGLPWSLFTFVSPSDFLNQNLASSAVSISHAATLFTRSTPLNNYFVANGKVINPGLGREQRAAVPAERIKEAAPRPQSEVAENDEPAIQLASAQELPPTLPVDIIRPQPSFRFATSPPPLIRSPSRHRSDPVERPPLPEPIRAALPPAVNATKPGK